MTRSITITHSIAYYPDYAPANTLFIQGAWYVLEMTLSDAINVDSRLFILTNKGERELVAYDDLPPDPAALTGAWFLFRGAYPTDLTVVGVSNPSPIVGGKWYYKRSNTAIGYYKTWEEAYLAMVAASTVVQSNVEKLTIADLEAISPVTSLAIGGTAQLYAIGGIPPYTWSVSTPGSTTPTISSTGVYVAGTTAATDTITVTDSRGSTDPVTIQVCVPEDLEYEKEYSDEGTIDPRPPYYGDPCQESVGEYCFVCSVINDHAHECTYDVDTDNIILVSTEYEDAVGMLGAHTHTANKLSEGYFELVGGGHNHLIDINEPPDYECEECIFSTPSIYFGDGLDVHYHKMTVRGVDLARVEDNGSPVGTTAPIQRDGPFPEGSIGEHTHPIVELWNPETGIPIIPNPGFACYLMTEVEGHVHFVIMAITPWMAPWSRRMCDELEEPEPVFGGEAPI